MLLAVAKDNDMTTHDDEQPLPRLADRLAAARRFVGRTAELELFAGALAAVAPHFAVLYLHGPGGIGKSSLLQQYARAAAAAGRTVALVDSRNVDPSPQGFVQALSVALGLTDPNSAQALLAATQRPVLLLDTFETLTPLDGWLRERFLPELPAGSLVVIAGRNPLGDAWRSDSAWRDLTRVVSLRNLRPEESRAYLTERGIGPKHHAAVLAFAHGHPLALSLVADVVAQRGEFEFHPNRAPDVGALLLERFIQEVPNAEHRMALHALATARVLTEPMLRDALARPDVYPIFAWLRSLSFVEQGPFGLFPHDLAREVLDSDLRWRDPDGHIELHKRLRRGIVARIGQGNMLDQQRTVFDLVYLHRNNPILKPYYRWNSFGTLYAEPVRPADHAAVLQRIAEFAGEDAAELAEHWLERQPAAWQVIRDATGQIGGIFMYLGIHLTSAEERASDPAVAFAWDYAQGQAPLRPGDEMTFARYYVDPATYREASAALNTAQITTGQRWMTSPRLAWAFTDLFDPDHWYAMMSYYNFHRIQEPRFGLYAHDWRKTPVAEWIEKMSARELVSDLEVDVLAAESAPLLVLSQPEFAEAVRAALRDYHTPTALAASPLVRARVVRDHASDTSPVEALRALLREGVAALQARPRELKFARALEATYLTPALTQELAAERLGLPFSTYRYQLAQGLERLTAWLWQHELYGAEG